jgi:hypothetical protein
MLRLPFINWCIDRSSTVSTGNNRTARVFELAWEKYSKVEDPYEKSQPGKDQVPWMLVVKGPLPV